MIQLYSLIANTTQNLDVISVNFWHIAISLVNLVIMFVIVKKFFYKPVKKMIKTREDAIQSQFDKAKEAEDSANEMKDEWEKKMAGAEERADEIIKTASDKAKITAERIVRDAETRADGIIKRAESEAVLEKKKAEQEIKREIIDVSSSIAGKMLEREVNPDDHRNLIDSFIEKIGENNDGNK